MSFGGALRSVIAVQRLWLGQALRRAYTAAGLFLIAFVLVVIALVFLAWSGFYLVLPNVGPAGAALLVGLIALGFAAAVALIGVLVGRPRHRRRRAAVGASSGGLEDLATELGRAGSKAAPTAALAALIVGMAVGALPILRGRRRR
jgi:hypothetical protein